MDGYKLKELRELACKSRLEFADAVGVDEDTVEQWEDLGCDPSSYQIQQIADEFDMDVDGLKWKLNVDRSIDDSTDSTDIGLGAALLLLGATAGLGWLASRHKRKKK